MGSYIGRQLLTIIPTVLLSIVINFALLHAAPGDPARIYAGMDTATEEQIAGDAPRSGTRSIPAPVQFVNYVKEIAQGNLGISLAFRQPVFDLIMDRLPATLLLTLTSAVIAFIGGTLLGAVAARKQDSLDRPRALVPQLHLLLDPRLLAGPDPDSGLRLQARLVPDLRHAQRPRRLHRVARLARRRPPHGAAGAHADPRPDADLLSNHPLQRRPAATRRLRHHIPRGRDPGGAHLSHATRYETRSCRPSRSSGSTSATSSPARRWSRSSSPGPGSVDWRWTRSYNRDYPLLLGIYLMLAVVDLARDPLHRCRLRPARPPDPASLMQESPITANSVLSRPRR